MFRKRAIIAAVILSCITSACGRETLSTADAQRAIDQWTAERKTEVVEEEVGRQESYGLQVTDERYAQIKSNVKVECVVKVLGVQGLPDQNAATADLSIEGFLGTPEFIKGSGKAQFAHYSDGRWVLTEVNWPGGNARTSIDLR